MALIERFEFRHAAPGWRGKYFDMGKGDSPSPPDYTPVAQASEEAARIAAEQADRVLAESQRQYDQNMAVTKPIVDAQTRIMEETERQGKDYYDYMVANQRPVEAALNDEAMAAGTEAKQQEMADRAVADSQGGYTRSLNQVMRQGRRYGIAPIAATGTMAVQQAQNTATAANSAREKERTLGYAKKMDVAGLYRGLTGASSGAYATAINSGNSANQNQQSPGNALIAGMGTAGNMTIQGQGQKLSGLSSILSSQSSIYNNSQSNDGGFGSLLGGLGGIGQGLGAMNTAGFFAGSDRRMKEHIEHVGADEATGLPLYEFNYIGDEKRYRGVMADEVEQIMPDAVVYDDLGFASVNYGMLGIRMEEV